MKVALVVYRDDERAGGSVRVAEILANSLVKLDVDLSVIVAYAGSGRLSRLLGDRCAYINARSKFDLRAWWRYRRLLAQLSPDIVHYIDPVAWMTLAGAGSNPLRVAHQHARPGAGHRTNFGRMRWLLGSASRVIAISEGAGRQLVEKCGIPSKKVSVVHNSIDPAYLNIGEREVIMPLVPKTPAKRILGMAIRVVEDKGVEDALNLLTELPPNYTLAIAGEGPAKARLEKVAEEMALSDRIQWLGSVFDIRRFYSSIDYYLFMSWYEGFGLSVAEAMFCRIPVVGLLGDGEIAEPEYPLVNVDNCLLFGRSNKLGFVAEANSRTIQTLAEAVMKLDSELEGRNVMIENARRWVENRFTANVQAERTLCVYRKVLSERRV